LIRQIYKLQEFEYLISLNLILKLKIKLKFICSSKKQTVHAFVNIEKMNKT